MFTLTLNNKVLANDIETWEDAERLSAQKAHSIYKYQPNQRWRFPWGFAFRIKETKQNDKTT